MADHTKLHVWQRSMALSISIHKAARDMSTRVAPGLRTQLLRAAAAIPANIAEGAGQYSDAKFAHFLSIAIGSANEVETHLRLARALEMFDEATCDALELELRQIRAMLIGLRRRLLAGVTAE